MAVAGMLNLNCMSGLTFLFLLFVSSLALADSQTITLTDGSQIKGELIDIAGSTYTIRTAAMGDIHVQNDQVRSITQATMPQQPSNQQPVTDMNQAVNDVQAQIMSDPEFLGDIQQLVQDPEIMNLLSDPAILQAAMAKDASAIQDSPSGQELLNNPKLRELAEKLQKQQK